MGAAGEPTPAAAARALRLEWARKAHARGWPLIPLNGKVPTLDAWSTAPVPDLDTVLRWATKGNVGLRTGDASGVYVVDEDTAKGGVLPPLPVTPTVRTGGGGRHLYFKRPAGERWGNTASRIAPHVDTRGDGGQVVFVGSIHPETGALYVWESGASPDDVALAELPGILIDRLTERPAAPPPRDRTAPDSEGCTPYGRRALESECWTLARASTGMRNDALNRAGFNLFQLVPAELSESAVERALLDAAGLCGLIADDGEGHVLGTIAGARRAGLASPREAPARQPARDLRTMVEQSNPAGAAPNTTNDVLIPGGHLTDGGDYVEVGADDFATACLLAFPPGALYRRSSVPGELVGDPGSRTFREATVDRVRLLVDEHARLVRWARRKQDDGPRLYYQSCTRDLAGLVREAATSHPAVRELRFVASYPFFLGPDFRLAAPGWNPDAGTERVGAFYDEPSSLSGLPMDYDDHRAKALLEDLLVDFHLKDDAPVAAGQPARSASRENAFGMILTPMLRPALEGNVPMHLLLSPIPRTGKSKLAEQVLGGIYLGKPTPARQFGSTEEEREKRIVAVLLAGVSIVHFDNLRDFLDSGHLASLLTGSTFSARRLGTNDAPDLPNHLTIVASGNNVRATEEIVKRTVPIWFAPKTDTPEDRNDFHHPDLPAYVAERRRDVLGCLVSMVTRWRDGGRPLGLVPKGGFERWSEVVGGVLLNTGFGWWRRNERSWARAADTDGSDLRELVEAWAERWGDERVTAKQLLAIVEERGLFPHTQKAREEHGRLLSFSRFVLFRNVDAPVGGATIRRRGSGSSSFYYLET